MKITQATQANETMPDEMLPEYDFGYSKARPNRFASRIQRDQLVVVLDSDVAEVFTTPESVNTVLRALIQTMPKPTT